MEARKLIKFGRSSTIISLPKEWLEYWKLEPGDTISLDTRNNLITLKPNIKEEGERKIILKSNHETESLLREIIATYLNGYDIIEIESNGFTVEQISLLNRINEFLTGIELVECYSKKALLKCYIQTIEYPIVEVKRMANFTRTLLKDLIKAIEENNKELASSIIEKDSFLDRLYFLVLRQVRCNIKYSSTTNPLELLDTQAVCTRIERISDHICGAAEQIPLNKRIMKELVKLGNESSTILNKSLDSYLKKNLGKAHETINQRKKLSSLEEKTQNIANKLSLSDAITARKILYDFKRINDYCSDLCESVINTTLQ